MDWQCEEKCASLSATVLMTGRKSPKEASCGRLVYFLLPKKWKHLQFEGVFLRSEEDTLGCFCHLSGPKARVTEVHQDTLAGMGGDLGVGATSGWNTGWDVGVGCQEREQHVCTRSGAMC